MTIDEVKRLIDLYWPLVFDSAWLDELLTEFYYAYAEALALAQEAV